VNGGSVVTSLLWFVAVVAAIPAVLWLLKRTPAGGAAAHGLLRHVAALPLSPNQKLLVVEVGAGDARRWLVLGVTAQSIATLHEMAPLPEGAAAEAAPPFAQLLAKLQRAPRDGGPPGAV
jgi:flagellar protein FliO/FliZ